jgi:Yip1 domain
VFSFVQIFTQPGEVFASVRQKRIWLAPFFAAVLFLTLPTIMVIATSGIELLTLQRYQRDPKLAETIGGERGIERAVNSSNDRWTKMLVVSRVAGSAAAGLIVLAAALMFAAGLLDERPNFFAMLGTVSYSVFPFALIGAVLTLAVLNVTADHSTLDLENMPGLNLSNLLDRDDSNPAIFSMAAGMDILVIGEMLLMSFGLTRLTTLTYIQALAICGGLWTLAVLWKAALMVYL